MARPTEVSSRASRRRFSTSEKIRRRRWRAWLPLSWHGPTTIGPAALVAAAWITGAGTGCDDPRPALPLGEVCAVPDDCASGHCTDGVCCAVAACGAPGDCSVCDGLGECTDPEAGSSCVDEVLGAGVCDAAGGCATGACRWAKNVGEPYGGSVTTDRSNHVWVAVGSRTPVDLGCGPVGVAHPTSQLVLAKLDPEGTCEWSRVHGTSAGPGDLATDDAGDVHLAGVLGAGAVDLGCGEITGVPNTNTWFVGKLDETGSCRWSRAIDPGAAVLSIAADPAGGSVITGSFGPTLDLGCGAEYSEVGALFVAKLDGAGRCVWSKRAGGYESGPNLGAPVAAGQSVAVDGEGNVIVTGYGAVDLGCGPVEGGFVAKLDAAGGCVWTTSAVGVTGATEQAMGVAVAADAAGNVVVTGSGTAADFGCGGNTRGDGYFLTKLDPAGSCVWSIAGSGAVFGADVAFDGSGNAIVIGMTSYDPGAVDFGCGSLWNPGWTPYVAKLDPDGRCLWSEIGAGWRVATDTSDHVLVTGTFRDDLGLGCGLASPGADRYFVAKLAP